MQLIKHTHACVSLIEGDRRIVIDPGSLTPDAAELVAAAEAVLITHEHFDHFDEELIGKALQERPDLQVFGPASIVQRWSDGQEQVRSVVAGDRIVVAGFEISVHGDLHAQIHQDIPRIANVGYLIERNVYHPGDAYHVPSEPVHTLLLPTSGPWSKLGDAVDYVRAVAPQRLIQIHEFLLSEAGQQLTANLLSPAALSQVPLTILPVGAQITI